MRRRLPSAAFASGAVLFAGVAELAVQTASGMPGVGFVVVAVVSGALALLGVDPAGRDVERIERRSEQLEAEAARLRGEIQRLESPHQLVKNAQRLERMRRYGPLTGSHGGLRDRW